MPLQGGRGGTLTRDGKSHEKFPFFGTPPLLSLYLCIWVRVQQGAGGLGVVVVVARDRHLPNILIDIIFKALAHNSHSVWHHFWHYWTNICKKILGLAIYGFALHSERFVIVIIVTSSQNKLRRTDRPSALSLMEWSLNPPIVILSTVQIFQRPIFSILRIPLIPPCSVGGAPPRGGIRIYANLTYFAFCLWIPQNNLVFRQNNTYRCVYGFDFVWFCPLGKCDMTFTWSSWLC